MHLNLSHRKPQVAAQISYYSLQVTLMILTNFFPLWTNKSITKNFCQCSVALKEVIIRAVTFDSPKRGNNQGCDICIFFVRLRQFLVTLDKNVFYV